MAYSKLVSVAIDWQEGGRGQDGNGRGLGHGPANERKGPVKGLLIDGRVETVDGAKKRPLGDSKGLGLSGLASSYRYPPVLTEPTVS